MTTYILFGILGIVVIWFIAIYNGFVRLVNRVKEAWADIDVQLKRRYDLIRTWWKRLRATPRTKERLLRR